jgi:murein DD-endopeptidase MepM/ murein hydrolase activator NlpD
MDSINATLIDVRIGRKVRCRSGYLVLIWAVAFLATASFARTTAASKQGHITSKSWVVRWQPPFLINGTPVVFRISPPAPLQSLAASWLGHDIFFAYDAPARAWYGFGGISLKTRPGVYPLTLKARKKSGTELSVERQVSVRPGRYPSISVTVAKQYTEPSPEQLQEIKQDTEVKQELFQRITPDREWSGPFHAPVTAPISDVFGTRRTFNGKVQSVHQGLDYAVPRGTPVSTLNSGTVLLAQPLFFEGNCVVVDHGQGLLSLYLHLSEIKVKQGERVERGQEIGLSGGTGRATGPHLHIAVRWQGVYLNPATLLRLKLP